MSLQLGTSHGSSVQETSVAGQRDSQQIGASLCSLCSIPRLPQFPRPAAGPDTRLNPPSPSLGGCSQAPRSARHQRSQEAASKLFVFPDNGSLSCCFPALGAWSDPAPVWVTAHLYPSWASSSSQQLLTSWRGSVAAVPRPWMQEQPPLLPNQCHQRLLTPVLLVLQAPRAHRAARRAALHETEGLCASTRKVSVHILVNVPHAGSQLSCLCGAGYFQRERLDAQLCTAQS